jgi:hypothetical protein
VKRWVVGQCRTNGGDEFMFCLADVECAEVYAALRLGDFLLMDVSPCRIAGSKVANLSTALGHCTAKVILSL